MGEQEPRRIVLCPFLLLLLSTDTNLSRTDKDILITRSFQNGYYVIFSMPCREYQVTAVVFVPTILRGWQVHVETLLDCGLY
jgi:hypothetical protein